MSAAQEILDAKTAFHKWHGTIEGKIGLYVSLAFFLLWAIHAAVSMALRPSFHLPGTLQYETKGMVHIPCDKKYLYGFHVRVMLDSYGSFWSMTCRNAFGPWHWRFEDEPYKF